MNATSDQVLASRLAEYLDGLRVQLSRLQGLLEELEQRNEAAVAKPADETVPA